MRFNNLNLNNFKWLKVEEVFPPEVMGIANRWSSNEGVRPRILGTTMHPYSRKVNIRLLGPSRIETNLQRNMLYKMLLTKDLAILEFDDETTYEIAKLDGSESEPYDFDTSLVVLTFACPFGCSFGESKTVTPIGNVYVEGSIETPPILTFTPTTANVSITNTTTGKFLKFQGLPLNQEIVVDCESYTVRQGQNSLRHLLTFDSDYLKISPGENSITTSGITNSKIEWIERWQ